MGSGGRYSLKALKTEYEQIHRIYTEGGREVRKALNELANMPADQAVFDKIASPFEQRSPEMPLSDQQTSPNSSADEQPDEDPADAVEPDPAASLEK